MLKEWSEGCYVEGWNAMKNKKVSKAISSLQKTISLDKNAYKAYNLLGICYYQLGDFALAKEAWTKSIALQMEKNDALRYIKILEHREFQQTCQRYNEALQLAKQREYKNAIWVLENIEKEMNQVVPFYHVLGLCKYGRNQKKEALKRWMQALEIDQSNPLTLRYIQQVSQEIFSRPVFLQWLWK